MENKFSESDNAEQQARRATVLFVENDPGLELLVTQKFRREIRQNELGFIFVQSGSDAIDKLREEDIDVVVTDLQLSGIDGLTLLSKLKQEYPHVRSVVISSYGDMRTIRRALNLGAFDFLTKPIDLDDLGVTIIKTIEEALALKHAVRDKERLTAIGQELEVARRIQLSMIPRTFPAFPDRPEFDIYGDMKTAREVGGDFYDFCMLGNDRLYFAIGDASGKGVPAALFMAVTRTMIKADAVKGLTPDRCLAEANRILCMENEFSMFITVFCGILDIRSGEVVYSNGGHKLPFLLRSDGRVEAVENSEGIALGVIDRAALYGVRSIVLNKGDSIFLYSDGVTEAVNKGLELYTDKRLRELLASDNSQDIRERVEGVLRDVERFSDGARQTDDMTVLAIGYN